MKLDFNPSQSVYFLRVNRAEGVDIQALMHEHGLDLSTSASSGSEAVLS